MADSGIRIGLVSSYDEETGTASIYYPDRCDEVTDNLPVFAPFGMLQKLHKGDFVIALHLSNGSEAGVVLGCYSSDGDVTAARITTTGESITFEDSSGTITLREIIEKCREDS